MTAQQRILTLLAQERQELNSISDIAKKLKIAYSHAHRYVKLLQHKNVITIKKVGGALICSLNRSEPLTRALLAQRSYEHAQAWRKHNPHSEKIMQRVHELRAQLRIVAMHNKRVLIVPAENAQTSLLERFHNRKLLSQQEIHDPYYKDVVILYGAEHYWE